MNLGLHWKRNNPFYFAVHV